VAKGENIVALVKAALSHDHERVITMSKMIVANEPANSSLRVRLQKVLASTPVTRSMTELLPRGVSDLLLTDTPRLSLAQTVLPDSVSDRLDEVIEDQRYAEKLRDAGLSVPHKILLSGPPGNGKTTLAGALSAELDLPFFVLDFSSIVSSHMGETGSKLAKIFRGVAAQPCVIFLDEMETLLSERAGNTGTTEVGEAKRIVSTLLLEIDRLPEHVILIGATNHEEMLDRAVVRRFDYNWQLPAPCAQMIDRWRHQFAARFSEIPVLWEMPIPDADGRSLSDVERDAKKWCRRWVLSQARASQSVAENRSHEQA
jgi:SpoVK/Ycf46/Vps4 family AAA+-type ATPase